MVDIQLTDITTGAVDGSGVFDKLMVAVKGHITEEYENGRIKGSDYANVYLGALQGVLAQSVEYVLREKLTEVQIEGAVKDIEAKEVQIEAIVAENNIKQERHNYDISVLLPDEHDKNLKAIEDVSTGIELKTQQIEGVSIENNIKQEQNTQDLANKYVQQVRLDKEAAMLGLDGVMKEQNQNYVSGYVYTPKYVK